MSELDIAYLPNRWSKRFPPELIIEKHVDVTSKASQKVRAQIPCKLGIPYGNMKKEKIDLFGTDLRDDAPTVIFIHGGYWCDRTIKRESYGFIAENLHKNKIRTYFIGYELCPDVEISWILKEIEMATRKCMRMARNTKGIFIVGHSVGAHLAATLFMELFKNLQDAEQKLIKAAILISGLYDLVPISKTVINIPLKLNKFSAREASPLHQDIIGNGTEFFIFSAEFDGPGFIKQSKEFYEKLRSLNVKCSFEIIGNTDHFDCVELLINPDYELSIRILGIIKNAI